MTKVIPVRKRIFPRAKSGPSKNSMLPSIRNITPAEVMPTPIFCVSVLCGGGAHIFSVSDSFDEGMGWVD